MPKTIKVLFVCTDNIGRSLTAEYLLKDYLFKNKRTDIEVFSAGTEADSDISSFYMDHIGKLAGMWIDTSNHRRTQITKELVADMDVVIAMDTLHQQFMKNYFDASAPLFNEVCTGESTSIRVSEPNSKGHMSDRLVQMVNHIHQHIPILIERLDETRSYSN